MKRVRKIKYWSRDEIKMLRKASKDRTPVRRLVRTFKRSEGAIRQKGFSLGLSIGEYAA